MGLQKNMQIDGAQCTTIQIQSKFRECLGENPADIHFDLQQLGLLVVMNIINGIVMLKC